MKVAHIKAINDHNMSSSYIPGKYREHLVPIQALSASPSPLFHYSNGWITSFNRRNKIDRVPNFSTWGTRKTTQILKDGSPWEVKTHRGKEWRQTEARPDMLHLNDAHRIKMGRYITNFFQGELERKGPLL